MRRCIVTPLLLTAAAIAALLAPRLLPEVVPGSYDIPPVVPAHVLEITATPEATPRPIVVPDPVVSEPVVSEPVVSEPVVSEPVVSAPAFTPTIPELNEPAPLPEAFWIDAVDCGMG